MVSVADEMGKEPGNWELYRGIERVEAAVHEIAKTSVPAAVFAVEKQGLDARIDAQATELATLKAAQLVDRGALAAYQKEQDAQKGRNRLFVYGIVAAALAPRIVELIFAQIPVG